MNPCEVCKRPLEYGKMSFTVRSDLTQAQALLCLSCFQRGRHKIQKGPHTYQVSENLATFPLLIRDWSAAEELTLVQAIMKCGLGNWNDVAEALKERGKTPQECEDHFMALYLGGGFNRQQFENSFITCKDPKPLTADVNMDGTHYEPPRKIDDIANYRNVHRLSEYKVVRQR